MEFNLLSLVRDNIQQLVPYSSARQEYSGEASAWMDANENPFGSPLPHPYNRYPDPQQSRLKERISEIKGVPVNNIFLGNGSDEAIDLLLRVFCEPGRDNIVILPPTYGIYEVCAQVNHVRVKKVPLTNEFQIDLEALQQTIDPFTKIIFICSPNNPTGNSIDRQTIELILANFDGIVVLDEAYINYARQKTLVTELADYPNLVVLQTLSKAWGLAGLRIGIGLASTAIVGYLNKVKYPYNISTANQELALIALSEVDKVNEWIQQTVNQRQWLADKLKLLPVTQLVYPSDSNFLLVKFQDASGLYQFLATRHIIVRDRSHLQYCEGSLRITIGTPVENEALYESILTYQSTHHG